MSPDDPKAVSGKTQNGCDFLHSLDPNSFVKLQWGKA
jgi:hypothetical protein